MTGRGCRIESAMVLAAGRGERMRPLTESVPKPLIGVNGRTLLDAALERLRGVGVVRGVINTHYLGDQIESHLSGCSEPALEFSREAEPLDTGGGVAKALRERGEILAGSDGKASFFVSNTDVLVLDGPVPALERMRDFWDPDGMDALLLLAPTVSTYGYDGNGDFLMDEYGTIARPGEGAIAPFMFTGIQILKPDLFDSAPDGAFSLNAVYDQAIGRKRLYGLRHESLVFHVGTPEALDLTRRYIDTPELIAPFF